MEQKLRLQLGFERSVSETKTKRIERENKMARFQIPVTISVETFIVVEADDKQEALAELYDMKNKEILKHLVDEELDLVVDKSKIKLVDEDDEEEIEAEKDEDEIGFRFDDDVDEEEIED